MTEYHSAYDDYPITLRDIVRLVDKFENKEIEKKQLIDRLWFGVVHAERVARHGVTYVQKVEIVVAQNDKPSRVAQTVVDELSKAIRAEKERA